MPSTIRPATRLDAERLAFLDAQLFADDPLSQQSLTLEIGTGPSWVIEEEEVIVGYAVSRAQEGLLDILRLGVAKGCQGRGLGTRLLERALLGHPVSMLTVRKGSRAVAFYHQHRFRIVGDLGPAWVMKRDITSGGT